MANFRTLISLAAAGTLAVALAGCSTDSPTAPQQTATPGPGQPSTTTSSWAITISTSVDPVEVDGESTANVRLSLQVLRSDNGSAPPENATAILTTSDGSLTSSNGATGESVAVPLKAGLGSADLALFATADGTVVLQGKFEQSVGQKTLRVKLVEPPAEEEPVPLFIQSVKPSQGPPTGGTSVRINGSGFEEPTRVLFGSTPGEVKSVSSGSIRVLTPPADVSVGSSLAVNVTVQSGVNTATSASDTLVSGFTYTRSSGPTPDLRLISLTPSSGPNEGGTEVTIFGEGFEDHVQVFFGTAALIEAPVLSVSDSRIVALTPSATGPNEVNQNQIVDVLVRNVQSGSEDTLVSAYQYGGANQVSMFISSIAPSEGPYTGGTNVTVYGQGFEEPVAVEAAGAGQQVVSVTGTEIVFRTVGIRVEGCGEVSGPVIVTNIETNETAEGPEFTYRISSPTIVSITPTNQLQTGGGVATISGFDFFDPVRVLFGDVAAANSSASSDGTSVTATIPPYNGELPTETCDDNNDGYEGTRDVSALVSVTVTNLVTGCADTFPNAFRYRPVSSACQNDVDPDAGGDPPPP